MSANYCLKVHHGVRSLLALLIAPLLSLPAFAQTDPLFPVTPLFDIGAQQVLATGDFNGDGQADLVTILPDNGSSTLTIILNQSNTNPPLSVTTALNIDPFSLVAVDINNDKKLDLVFSVSAGIAVLIGNGDGTFQTPVVYPIVGSGKIAALDLNGDGYPDLVFTTVTNPNLFQVAVLLNQGTSAPGVFSSKPVSYPLSITYSSLNPVLNIGSGDFNGDGKQDIFVGGTNTAVFYGNGDGTLQAQQSPPVPAGLSGGAYFVAADFNHDGISDIAYLATATFNPVPLSLQVMLGHSNGVFTIGSNLPLGPYNTSLPGLIPAGTTGGNVNLAFINQTTTILLGDGNGNFSQGSSYPLIGAAFPIPGHNGNTDLAFELFGPGVDVLHNQITRLVSNGDGTFQGIPTLPVGPSGFAAADFNNDGLTDVLTVDAQNNLVTALGRGNGTFTVTNRTAGTAAELLVTADFNADGNQDAAIITPGDGSLYPAKPVVDSKLIIYKGNGDGTFQPPATAVDLQVIGALSAISGDFNGDGNIDIVASYFNAYLDPTSSYGLVFLPGKGDGTFGTPVPLQANNLASITPLILAADLNNDHKLDILWSGLVYLGNGDGTFQLSTASLPAPVLAVGDLNGDGIPDAVTGGFNVGASVYAGNGDGTFQNSPFYTATLPPFAEMALASITDADADGHPDLLLQYNVLGDNEEPYELTTASLTPFLGDGKGNFIAGSNTFYSGNPSGIIGEATGVSEVASFAVLARLNNLVPQQSKTAPLDYLTWTSGGATALLNQTNPAPTAPSLFPSKTTLAVSANNAAPTQQLTFTATVTGVIPPTGNVSFTSGSTTLGTASLTNGVATLSIAFPAVGTYAVTASYAGDANNQPSSSNQVSVAVATVTSKTTLTVSTSSANQNQQLTFTASVTGLNPTGNVTFVSGSTTLGMASLTNGTASLPFVFTTAGSFTVTANYAGDAANLTSVSNTVTIAVVAPDFTVSASPTTATIAPGQSATTTLSIAPLGGYNGTVTFSCGTLPAGVACTFAPASVTPASGATATTTLTITTNAPTTTLLRKLTLPIHGIAWASLILLIFSPHRLRKLNRHLRRKSLLAVFLAASLLSLAGCSSSPKNPTITNPGTPAGLQTITVTAADLVDKLSHTAIFQVTVQ
ncbi:FG-GAP-like repeat-containing protein [Tunturiibacter gelidiferens]|uniref:FG-GAP-like repeat-containing protein n=1 Tax=Tunturiibacter gelidiferens TaxID=3069689 RepID=UPI003D9AFB99